MATTKSKKTTAKKSSTAKTKAADTKSTKTVKTDAAKAAKTTNVETAPIICDKGEGNNKPLQGFFARKCDPQENILTIFKSPRIWGAVAGELIGVMMLTMLFLTLGLYQPIYIFFAMIAVTMAVYALSGAHLNPIITVGMMATRRVSAIRGVLYLVAQVVGAWLGLVVVNAFIASTDTGVELPALTALESETLWYCIFLELLGAIVFAFFYCRAQAYRSPKGALTYATLVAGGFVLALLFVIVISGNFLGLSSNFMLNPAIAIMFQIFPSSAESFGELMSSIGIAAATYIVVPMVGGVIGMFIADLPAGLACERTCPCGQYGCTGCCRKIEK